ncbi:phage gp6-like head-tail connector protein [Dryocola sp. LX212]
MNDRELEIIRAVSEEFGQTLKSLRADFDNQLSLHQKQLAQQAEQHAREIDALKQLIPEAETLIGAVQKRIDIPPAPALPDIPDLIRNELKSIPIPKDGKSASAEDIRPLLQKMVDTAVASLPAPQNGKDYDPDVLQRAVEQAVSDAVAALPVPKDGKSVTVDDVRPLLQQMVTAAVPDVESLVKATLSSLPAPEPGKPGESGRDALQLEILPAIDPEKSCPRGTYATHNGGLWRAYEKTHGMRGWECLVDGVGDISIQLAEDQRTLSVAVVRSSGATQTKTFAVPVQIYRGVFKSGETYQPGDTVTWAGSVWHCNSPATDKPGEPGSSGWTLAVKRGRDARGQS